MMKGDKIMVCAKPCASISCWIARIWSSLVIGVLLLFMFGEAPPITVLHICFPFGVMLGLILAWFFEGIGATIIIVSIVAFYSIHYSHAGNLPGGPFFLIAAAPSVFFLISKFMRRAMATETENNVQPMDPADSHQDST